ncbi:MAG: hypothetical protein DRJ61_16995 [Acidobacteria bacterium]|nr:MAG: hypothetical protein DRJ61_16995 [Acidobacteriota bacterium]
MRERRHTCGTSSERIEKTPKVVVVRALQPDTGEKYGLGSFQPPLGAVTRFKEIGVVRVKLPAVGNGPMEREDQRCFR